MAKSPKNRPAGHQITSTLYRRIGELEDSLARHRGEDAGPHRHERRLEAIIETLPVGIGLVKERRLQWFSGPLMRDMGYREEELCGRNARRFFLDAADYRRAGGDLCRQLHDKDSAETEIRVRRKDGEAHDLRVRVGLVDPREPSHGMLFTAFDISERRRFEDRLQWQINFDPLTRLPNRVQALDRLRQALARSERSGKNVGVLLVDLDNFKKVGETLGHAVGDEVLVTAARRLETAVRNEITVARLGGDEFLLVMPEISDVSSMQWVAERILSLFAEPFYTGRHRLMITASLGVTHANLGRRDPQHLIKDAEIAMYLAKRAGRNTYRFFTPELHERAVRHLEMESRLARSLQHGELAVHYQPMLNCGDGKPVAVEALLRWRNPDLGMVAPADFIPVAEQTGLINELGAWVLSTAASQLRVWRTRFGWPLRMAVNVSSCQFERGNLVEDVNRALGDNELPGDALELEITEGLLLRDEPGVHAQMLELRRSGVRLSIDDFGTGYSALSYLKRFPIDTIKIDRSFIRDLTLDTEDEVLTRTIILMGRGLGLEVIAEGVETVGQLAFLKAHDCPLAQGYYFSRPLAAEECGSWLGTLMG